jgi:Fur family ferric uptake transcriptional regulator
MTRLAPEPALAAFSTTTTSRLICFPVVKVFMPTKTAQPATTHAIDPTAWLREHGLRATRGRINIVRLLESSSVPLTLADIHEKVRAKGCDFATVFRFVSILEEKELVRRVAWIDGSTRHEIRTGNGHQHHHYLICRTCQKVEPLDECVVERFEDQIAKERGYSGLSHSLQLSGVCPDCQKPAAQSPRKRK